MSEDFEQANVIFDNPQDEKPGTMLIYKQALELTAKPQVIEMPVAADIVKFDMQNGKPTFWYLFCTSFKEKEKRQYRIVGTGNEFLDDSLYIGTCFDPPYVWHLIDETKED
jgi:hypothetical protein